MGTPVLFRTFEDGMVVGLFITVPASCAHGCMMCFMWGNAISGNYDHIMANTRPATDQESQELLAEIEALGAYEDLRTVNVRSEEHRKQFEFKLAEMRGEPYGG